MRVGKETEIDFVVVGRLHQALSESSAAKEELEEFQGKEGSECILLVLAGVKLEMLVSEDGVCEYIIVVQICILMICGKK